MRLLLSLILCLAAGAAIAGPASERLFTREAMNSLAEGGVVDYDHARTGIEHEGLRPIDDGAVRITLQRGSDGNRESAVQMGARDQMRPVSIFPAASGNPLLPIFLESSLRSMARITGGSVFYIRNRIKEALGSAGTLAPVEVTLGGKTLSAERIVFVPFETDGNRDRMGPFADLTLSFVVAEDVPGGFVSFRAETGDGAEPVFRETITYRPGEGG